MTQNSSTLKNQPTLAGFSRSLVSDFATRGNLALAAAALLVLGMGWSGGLHEAKPAGFQALNASATLTTRVEASQLIADISQARETENGLEVPMRVTVTGKRYFGGSLDLGKTFVLLDAAKNPPPQFKRVGGIGAAGINLSPGVPTDIIAVWPTGTSGDTLQVNSLTYRESSLDGSKQWFDPTPVAEVKIR